MSSRSPVSLMSLELLHHEWLALLLRKHSDSREQMNAKLEYAGFVVGKRFAERLAMSRDRPPEVLDVVKYVCRELWAELHQKPVDKLQTNNKGVFVLQDLNYRWTRYLSPPAGGPPSAGAEQALKYVLFPCGLVRGALAAFDVIATVTSDVSATPRVLFHIDASPARELSAPAGAPAAGAAAPAVAAAPS